VSGRPDIAIIGPGVVGTTLGVLAAKSGYRVTGVAGRGEASARASAERIGPDVAVGDPAEIAGEAGLVLLTVPDDAIEQVARELAEAGAFRPGGVVAHCSGALGSDVLSPARELCGSHVGAMHPLHTFPDVDAAMATVAGTYFFCEGDPQAVAALEALAAAIGGKPVRISSDAKCLYHASAVMACNYLAALLDAAVATAGLADIPPEQALAALDPLVRATVANALSASPAEALTGPIARGDERLVARQCRQINQADPRLGAIYRSLGVWAVEMALRTGRIDQGQADRLRDILANP